MYFLRTEQGKKMFIVCSLNKRGVVFKLPYKKKKKKEENSRHLLRNPGSSLPITRKLIMFLLSYIKEEAGSDSGDTHGLKPIKAG